MDALNMKASEVVNLQDSHLCSERNEGLGSGILRVWQEFTFHSQEEASQMCSKDTNSRNNSLLQDHEPQREENSENIPSSLQACGLETQTRQETAESSGCVSDEDEGIAQRLSTQPRGVVLVSEEELAQLAQLKPSLSKSILQHNAGNLIQKLQRQMEQQEILAEFVALEHMKPLDDCQVAKAPENREKNRYRDILPYDMTRVPLGKGKAYINASYIRVPAGKEELFYISTQGPLPCTMNDFWQMVWENHSNVIAMITKEVEHGIAKCHRYWPEPPHSSVALAQFHLQLVNYQILDCFIIRMIEIMNKQTQERRTVQHLQFTAWPDHSTPRSSRHLLQFVRYMRKIHRSGPIVTHCSAGVGRSGVLLCVDILLHGIERDLFFDIKQIVTHLRHQRFGMIQTKEQYMFCYEIALEALKNLQSRNAQLLQ
ncbi:tyrosine-protein phosphatase non-receptor type 20 [Varanus komodoensis]|uniref:tyrosine-protein phosphatase non-receptor type 20 n=1 Tax=Varanus komodoensis TaxID=61221 RepID=UPI001CF76F0C|nr:tyrosine-protein phosphatase non-receptor type 20 [Varanus komodoensis]